jgi:hypothetical protein
MLIAQIPSLDKFIAIFWNKDVYPALETIVIASHCMLTQPLFPLDTTN